MDSESDQASAPPEPGSGTGQDAFADSLRQFAEGATALTAASIRMQMMMLEQARGMMDDLARDFTAKPPEGGSDG